MLANLARDKVNGMARENWKSKYYQKGSSNGSSNIDHTEMKINNNKTQMKSEIELISE